jgi:hypothetical protein
MPRIELDGVFSSQRVFAGPKLSYQAHATTTYSAEQAIDILDIIGKSLESDDCLPFAMNLVDGGEVVSVCEDNGEFGAGEMLARSLQDLDGFNTLVCLSRKVAGVYVTEMLQPVKMKAMKAAVLEALGMLYQDLVKRENERDMIDAMRKEQLDAAHLTNSTKDLLNLSLVEGSASSLVSGESHQIVDGKKVRYRGSGPNGRETIFERTERQARERHEKEMQILKAKKLLVANRQTMVPKKKALELPVDLRLDASAKAGGGDA